MPIITDPEELKTAEALFNAPTKEETTLQGGMPSDTDPVYTQPDKTVGPMERLRLQSEAKTGVETTLSGTLARMAGDVLFFGDTREVAKKNALSDIVKGNWQGAAIAGYEPLVTERGRPADLVSGKVTIEGSLNPKELESKISDSGLDLSSIRKQAEDNVAFYKGRGEEKDYATALYDVASMAAEEDLAKRVHVSSRASRALPEGGENQAGLGYSVVGGGLQNVPYMGQYILGSMIGNKVTSLALPLLGSFDRRLQENMESKYLLDPKTGGVKQTEKGMGFVEGMAPSMVGAVGETATEAVGGELASKVFKGLGGGILKMTGADKAVKNIPILRTLVKSFDDIAKVTKAHNLPSELVEEDIQGNLDAAFQTTKDYRKEGGLRERLVAANKKFVKDLPEIASSMLLIQTGQTAAALPSAISAVKSERNAERNAADILKTLPGADQEKVNTILQDQDARAVLDHIASMTPEEATAAVKRMSARSVQTAEELKKTAEWGDATLSVKDIKPRFAVPTSDSFTPQQNNTGVYVDPNTNIRMTRDSATGEIEIIHDDTGRTAYARGGTEQERMDSATAIANAMDRESRGRDIVNTKKREMLAKLLQSKGVGGKYVIVDSEDALLGQKDLSEKAKRAVGLAKEDGNIPQGFVDDGVEGAPITYFVLDNIRMGEGAGAIGKTLRNIVDAATHEPFHRARYANAQTSAIFRDMYDKSDDGLRLDVIKQGIALTDGKDNVNSVLKSLSASADDSTRSADAKEKALRRYFEEGVAYSIEGSVTAQSTGYEKTMNRLREFFKGDIRTMDTLRVMAEQAMEKAKGNVELSYGVPIVSGVNAEEQAQEAKQEGLVVEVPAKPTVSETETPAAKQITPEPGVQSGNGAVAVEPVAPPASPAPEEEQIAQTPEAEVPPVAEEAPTPTPVVPETAPVVQNTPQIDTPAQPSVQKAPESVQEKPEGVRQPQEEAKAGLSEKQLAEVAEYEDLAYKSTAKQGPEKGYKPYPLTVKQRSRLVELRNKYRFIYREGTTPESKAAMEDLRQKALAEAKPTAPVVPETAPLGQEVVPTVKDLVVQPEIPLQAGNRTGTTRPSQEKERGETNVGGSAGQSLDGLGDYVSENSEMDRKVGQAITFIDAIIEGQNKFLATKGMTHKDLPAKDTPEWNKINEEYKAWQKGKPSKPQPTQADLKAKLAKTKNVRERGTLVKKIAEAKKETPAPAKEAKVTEGKVEKPVEQMNPEERKAAVSELGALTARWNEGGEDALTPDEQRRMNALEDILRPPKQRGAQILGAFDTYKDVLRKIYGKGTSVATQGSGRTAPSPDWELAGLYHVFFINNALDSKVPVNASAVETYGVKLPDGYVKEGDMYVYKAPAPLDRKGRTPARVAQLKEVAAKVREASAAEPVLPKKTEKKPEAEMSADEFEAAYAENDKTNKKQRESDYAVSEKQVFDALAEYEKNENKNIIETKANDGKVYYTISSSGKRKVTYSVSENGAPQYGFYSTPKSISNVSREEVHKFVNERMKAFANSGSYELGGEWGQLHFIFGAIEDKKPVNATVADKHNASIKGTAAEESENIDLTGYVREGDLYVFKPTTPDKPAKKTISTPPAREPEAQKPRPEGRIPDVSAREGASAVKQSPLQTQYAKLKASHPTGVLAVRLGDFVEFFENDAEVASKVLGVKMDNRNGVRMTGVPYHAVDASIKKLTAAGQDVHKVDYDEKAKTRFVSETIPADVTPTPPDGKKPAPKSSIPKGAKVVTTYDDKGVSFSGEFIQDNGDGTATFRAFGQRPKKGLFRRFGVDGKGVQITKEMTVPSDTLKATEPLGDLNRMTPAQREAFRLMQKAQDAKMEAEIKAGRSVSADELTRRAMIEERRESRKNEEDGIRMRTLLSDNAEYDLDVKLTPKEDKRGLVRNTIAGIRRQMLAEKDKGAIISELQTVEYRSNSTDAHNREMELSSLAEIERIFRKTIVFVDGGDKFGGMINTGYPNVIFVNARTKHPYLQIVGHELSHLMMVDNPSLYAEVEGFLSPVLGTSDEARDLMIRGVLFDKDTIKDYRRERIADLFGNQFSNPEFWDLVRSENPTLFKRLSDYVLAWIDKVFAKWQGARMDATPFFGDLKNTQDAIAKAIEMYAVSQQEKGEDGIRFSISQPTEGTTDENRQRIADDNFLPKITLPDSIQREMQGGHRARLTENLRGVHREYQKNLVAGRKAGPTFRLFEDVQQELREKETAIIEKHIADNNLFIDPAPLFAKFADYRKEVSDFGAGGMEHIVYVSPDDRSTIFKMNNLMGYSTWLDYLNTLAVHNFLFPETAYEIVGFTRDPNVFLGPLKWNHTNIRPVVKQPFVAGVRPAEKDDMRRTMDEMGFADMGMGNYTNPKFPGIIVTDLHNLNGQVHSNGAVVIFDPMIKTSRKFGSINFRMDQITPEEDKAYMDAVSVAKTTGVWESVQKMVDMAAKKAGFKFKAFHGGTVGNTFARDFAQEDEGFFFSSSEELARGYRENLGPDMDRVREVIESASDEQIDAVVENQFPTSFFDTRAEKAEAILDRIQEDDPSAADVLTAVMKQFGKRGSDFAVLGGRTVNAYLKIRTPKILERQTTRGETKVIADPENPDGVIRYGFMDAKGAGNFGDGVVSVIYSVPNASQIKDASAITLDDQGNIIPLSKRFNEESDDIRFRIDQTDTPAFKAFFKDSKVVDADGKPLVMYHGSPNKKITVFKSMRDDPDNVDLGVWLTSSKEEAKDYYEDEDGRTGKVYALYASAVNPIIIRTENGMMSVEAEQAFMENEAYDSIISYYEDGSIGTVVVRNPNQIKSATANVGTFDAGNPDIRFSMANENKAKYDAVVAQYKGTDAWLKAPNGQPSNLFERLWVLVRTPAFKNWFGDWEKFANKKDGNGVWSDADKEVSKVVDANGEPLVVYHGSTKFGFTEMDPYKADGHRSPMIFATDDLGTARSYANGRYIEHVKTLEEEVTDDVKQYASDQYGWEWETNEERDVLWDELSESEQFDVLANFRSEYGEDEKAGVYPLFLNIRDPFESHFEGRNWDGGSNGLYEVQNEDGEIQYDGNDNGLFDEDAAEAFANELSEKTGESYRWTESEGGDTTNSVAEEAKRFGNDGAIIRKVLDDGGRGGSADIADVFVFFDANQAKSALDNTGEFGPLTNDIRFSMSQADDAKQAKAKASFDRILPLMDNPVDEYRSPTGIPIVQPQVLDKAQLDRIVKAIVGEDAELPTPASVNRKAQIQELLSTFNETEVRDRIFAIANDRRDWDVDDDTLFKMRIFMMKRQFDVGGYRTQMDAAEKNNDATRINQISEDTAGAEYDIVQAANALSKAGSKRGQALQALQTGMDKDYNVVYRVRQFRKTTGHDVSIEDYRKLKAQAEADAASQAAKYEELRKELAAEANKRMEDTLAKAKKAFDAQVEQAYRKGARDERDSFEYLLNDPDAEPIRRIDPAAGFEGIDIGGIAFRVGDSAQASPNATYPGALRDLARSIFLQVQSEGGGVVIFGRRMMELGRVKGFKGDMIARYVYDFSKRLGLAEVAPLKKMPVRSTATDASGKVRKFRNEKERRDYEVKNAVKRAVAEDLTAPGNKVAQRAAEILEQDMSDFAYLTPEEIYGVVTGYPVAPEADTRDELEKRYAMIRRHMLALQRTGEMANGVYPTKMTAGNDAPDVTLRQLSRDVREMMNNFTFPADAEDPRLVNAQKALSNRLKYAIEELQKAIDTGTPTNEKTPKAVEETPEIKSLRNTLRELREAYEAMPSVEAIRDARNLERARSNANKRYHFWTKRAEEAKEGRYPETFKGTTETEMDAEVASYKAKALAAQKEYWQIKKESPQERLAVLTEKVTKAEARLASLEEALAVTPVADPSVKKEPFVPANAEEAAMQAKLDAARTAIDNVRKAILAKYRDENAEMLYKVKEAERFQFLSAKAANIEKKIKDRDFTKAPKRKPVTSGRIVIAEAKVRQGQRTIEERIQWEANAAAGWTGKAKNYYNMSGNLYRFFKASYDISNVGVQSARLFTAHPLIGARLIRDSVSNSLTDEKMAEYMAAMHMDADYEQAYNDGLALDQQFDDVFGTGMGESVFRGFVERAKTAPRGSLRALAGLIPEGALISQRAFDIYGRAIRFEVYKSIVNDPAHASLSPIQRKAVANMVNIMGGIGNTKMYNHNFSAVLSNLMWSSRLFTAQVQTAIGGGGLFWNAGLGPEGSKANTGREWYETAAPGAVKLYARSIAGNIALAQVFAAVGMLLGDRQPWEDEESLFWKAYNFLFGRPVIGAKNFDFSGGLTTYTALVRKGFDGTHVAMSGRNVSDEGFAGKVKLLSNFFRGRLRPDLAVVLNVAFGEDVTGEKFGPRGGWEGMRNMAAEGILPITPLALYETTRDIARTHGWSGIAFGLIPSLAGDVFGFAKGGQPRDARYEIERHKSHMGQVNKALKTAKETGEYGEYDRLRDLYIFDVSVDGSVGSLDKAGKKALKVADDARYPADVREQAKKDAESMFATARDILLGRGE